MRAHEFTDQGAAGIVLYAEDTGRYGLQQRSDNINDPGLWAAWGGGREPGETLEQCATRELAEEGGYTGPIKLKRIGENARYVTFLGTIPQEFEPRPCDEWQDYCWVEAGDWPEPIHPGTAAALKNIPVNEDTTSQDVKDVADWMRTDPDKLSIVVKQEPIEKFIKQIREMYGTYDEFPEDEQRTNRILKLLKRGAKLLPIYVEANDPDLFVMEGRHRMVAFWLAGMKTIPVAYVSHSVNENFADGKVKGKSRPGRVKRAGASCSGSVTDLRAKARKYGGERGKMYHWCANMKSGRAK